jgi:hypothetical protein
MAPLSLALLQKAQAEAEGFANGPAPALNNANIYTQDSIGNPQTPGTSPTPYYPSAETPNLQLSTRDMAAELANNFVILDGGVLKVNGVIVPNPSNFVNSPSVTFSVIGSNVSAVSVSSSVWASLTGDLTQAQVIPWDGPIVGTKDTGVSRIGVASLAIGNGISGDFSGSLKLTGINNIGTYTDSTGAVGTLGQVLKSTVTGTQWGTASGGSASSLTLSPINILSGGADVIDPHTSATYMVTTAGVNAMTLAAPTVTTDDGKVIKVTLSTNAAHTITCTGGTLRPGTAAVTTVNFASFRGSSIELMAWQGNWYVMAQNLVASYT